MDKYQRIHLKNCKIIKTKEQIQSKTNAVIGEYYVQEKGKKGFYKKNGCTEASNKDEDLRELLASEILDEIDIPHAEINLIYDDDKNDKGCISYSVLKKGEKILKEEFRAKSSRSVEEFINNNLNGLKFNSEMTNEFIEKRKKYLACNIFANALINNIDIKIDNMPIIFNMKNDTYRNAPCFGFSKAFTDSDEETKFGMTTKEIIRELFEKYYYLIKDIVRDTIQNLNNEKIDLIMNKLTYKQGFKLNYNKINEQLKSNLYLINELEKEQKINEVKKNYADSIRNKGISLNDIRLRIKDVKVIDKDKVVQKLKAMSLKQIQQITGGIK